MDLLRRMYRGLAVLALIHMALFAALVGLAAANGLFSGARIKAVIAAIHPTPAPAEGAEAAAPSPTPAASPAPESEGATPAGPPDEIARRNLERQVLEASHQLVLANREMVEVTRRREELERQEKEAQEAQATSTQREAREAFAKDLEILGMMKAKIALDNLLARPDEDTARLLFALETRKSKAIIEAASKDPTKWARMLIIQKKMRDVSPDDPLLAKDGASKGAPPAKKPAPAKPTPAPSATPAPTGKSA